ncbi:MAG: hypothetical protein K9K37_00890 [Desulfocapsa sp.]|nr:hypothetical protein [Desulfocapsa sp.]
MRSLFFVSLLALSLSVAFQTPAKSDDNSIDSQLPELLPERIPQLSPDGKSLLNGVGLKALVFDWWHKKR